MSTNNNVAIKLKEEELKMQENKVKAKVNDIIIKCAEELNKQKNQQDSIVFAIDCLNCKNLKTFANENEYQIFTAFFSYSENKLKILDLSYTKNNSILDLKIVSSGGYDKPIRMIFALMS